MENLEGMVRYWQEHPEWMEMMDPASPVHRDKLLERALYLDMWEPYLPTDGSVLDLGGGVGRLAETLLGRNCEVQLVDPDLRSLWRAMAMVAGGPGRIDIHWTTGERLPPLPPLQTAIACEVLNYVEDPEAVVANVHRALEPGGHFLLSVEAKWGWAMAADAAEGTIGSFLDGDVVHVPRDRWIRTYDRKELETLLSDFVIIGIRPSHYALSGPFELAAGRMEPMEAIRLEEQLRTHPVAGQLNRAWMAVARKETGK